MANRSGAIRILHVDDDPDFVELASLALSRENDAFVVETETDPTEAVQTLSEGAAPIDCVVTDFDMPGMNGLRLIEAVREAHPHLPVILFTGKGSEEVASEAIAAGVTDYLQKRTGSEQFAVLANRIENAVERYRAEREIERAERRFRKLVEETVDVISVFDEDGNFEYVSPAVESVFGYSPEELIGDAGFDRVHPDDRKKAMDHFESLRAEPGSRRRVQCRVQARDGTWRHMDILGRNLLDDPDIGGLLLHGHDVTDRKRREQALAQLHETTRALMEAQSAEAVLDRGIEAAESILDLDIASFNIRDGDGLVPMVATEETEEMLDGVPVIEPGESLAWSVYESGDPIVTDDVRNREEIMNPDTPVRSEMILPIGDQGVFLASSLEVGAFSETDVSLAQVLVANIEAALERADRERLLREGEQSLATLNAATRQFVAADSREAVIDVLVRTAEDVLDLPLIGVWLFDEAADALVPAVYPDAKELPDEPPIFSPGNGVSWTVFADGETRLYEDLHDVEAVHNPETEIRSEIVAPIGEHGVMNSGSTEPKAFDETDRNLVDILTETAAAALDRVERETVLERLHTATRDLMGADSREEIGAMTADAARDVLGYKRALVRLRSDDGDELVPVAATETVLEGGGDRPTYRVGEGTAGRAFAQGEPIVYNVRELDDGIDRGDIESLLCIPLGEQGVLTVADDESETFDDAAIRLAMILASNAETALDRIDRETELERQNERLDEFARVVSHDLRNPLNVAMSYAQVLANESEDERMERVSDALGRMNAIIEDALSLARSGREIEAQERVPIAGLATEAWATAGSASAHLEIEGDPGAVLAHRGRARQLLENLFRNAREHAGEDVTVRVGRTEDGFYVEDDGPGIPETDRAQVVRSGYSTAPEGTGFGLAIVERIAEAHGWSLTIVDGRDGGARFEFDDVSFV